MRPAGLEGAEAIAVRDVWERIEAVLRVTAPGRVNSLAAGASPETIAAAEKRFGFALPEDVRDSYAVHDGSNQADILLHSAYGLIGVPYLSLEEAIRDREMWVGWLDGGSFKGRQSCPQGPIRAGWWNRRWVPVTWDGGGDHLCVDLDPAPGGTAGQVIYFSHEEGPLSVVANNWREYLLGYAGDLESGRLRFDGRALIAVNDI